MSSHSHNSKPMNRAPYTVNSQKGILEIRFHTGVGFQQIAVALAEVADSPETRWIWIFEESGQASSDELKDYINTAVTTMADREPRRVAIVAPQDLTFGMARMLEAFSGMEGSQDERRVFRSEEEAYEWLQSE